jgi:hypothetical protein
MSQSRDLAEFSISYSQVPSGPLIKSNTNTLSGSGGGYTSKTISANTVLDANTEYFTGTNIRINNNAILEIPVTTKLHSVIYVNQKTL